MNHYRGLFIYSIILKSTSTMQTKHKNVFAYNSFKTADHPSSEPLSLMSKGVDPKNCIK